MNINIESLYWNQKAQIRINGEETSAIEICRGIRQKCILSPLLFNLYSEIIFQEELEDIEKGTKINEEWLNNIRYADDIMLIADIDNLEQVLNMIGQHKDGIKDGIKHQY